MNRITHYALALALGLSVVSTAALAADPSQTQSASTAQGPNVAPTGTSFYSPYDSLSPALSPADVNSAS